MKTVSAGFTLIELLVVIGIIGILATVVVVAINPARQFASARDTQRRSDLYSLLNAIYQYAVEHNGNLPRDESNNPVISTTPGWVGTGGVDLTSYLVPNYITLIPRDPVGGTAINTKYMIFLDENGRVVATAGSELTASTPIRLTR